MTDIDMDEALLLGHELECHQFTEPLDPAKIKQPGPVRRAVAGLSGKVWFRVGWTCECVAKGLQQLEDELLLRGLIKESIDIYQLGYRTDVGASAGTHAKGACYDIGQYGDAAIDIQRQQNLNGQHRTPAQGFTPHCHGFPQSCPHGSAAQKAQQVQWNNRQNGLVSRGPIQGRWPTHNWAANYTKRAGVIMALVNDIAEAVAARIDYGKIADAVLSRQAIVNNFSGNAANKTVSLKYALEVLGARTKDIARAVWEWDNVPNTYDPADPNDTIAPASALKVLMARQRRQAGDTDLTARLDAIDAKLDQAPPA